MPRRWIVNASIDNAHTTCLVEGGRVVAVGPDLIPTPGEVVLDARGGAVLPGLIDHHIHLFALAAARASLDLSGVDDLATVTVPPGSGWVRATGARHAWTASELDACFGNRPVRVQHRSGALWILSTAAVDRLRVGLTTDECASGQMWRADRRLHSLLAAVGEPGTDLDLPAVGVELARSGLTRLTDATPGLDEAGLAALRRALPQRVESLSSSVPSVLPVKIVVADHDLPTLDGLVSDIHAAREGGRAVAVHAVTAPALALVLAALDEVGAEAEDRVEHAAVCADSAIARLRELRVTVVTQPSLWLRRSAEFLIETDADEHPTLWRHGSLARAGVRIAVSSDAPYGDADPWVTMHAAATREGPERVHPAETLRTLLTDAEDPAGVPRRVAAGAPAELVILDAPLVDVFARLERSPRSPVVATLIGDTMLPARSALCR